MNFFKTIIFDFDYTLVDASQGIIQSTNVTLEEMGFAPVGEEVIVPTIGLPLEEMFTYFVPEIHHADNELFATKYKANAAAKMTELTRVFTAVPGLLESLAKSGVRMGIVSTKMHIRIEEVLARFDLGKYFEIVIGGDEVEAYKPAPEGLLHAMEVLGSMPEETLYVGDSLTDAKTARNAGVAFVAVLTGATQREAFADFTPLKILNDLGELSQVLNG